MYLFLPFPPSILHQLNKSIIISLHTNIRLRCTAMLSNNIRSPHDGWLLLNPESLTQAFPTSHQSQTHLSVGKEPEQRASASSIGSSMLLSFSCLFNSDGARASTSQQRKRSVTKEWQLYPLFPAIWDMPAQYSSKVRLPKKPHQLFIHSANPYLVLTMCQAPGYNSEQNKDPNFHRAYILAGVSGGRESVQVRTTN